jgi:hypothetical protein
MAGVEDILKKIDEESNPELKAINKKHKKIRKGGVEADVSDNMSYDQFEKLVSDYYLKHHAEHYGGGKMSEALARSHARRMYRMGTGKSLKEAFVEAKTEGTLKEVLDGISDGFAQEEKQAYIVNILHKEIGDDHGKRKEFVSKIADMDGVSKDVSRDMLAGNYETFAMQRSRYKKQLKDMAAATAYRDQQ